MPVVGIGGSGYELLAMSLPDMATNLQLEKVKECGHFILAEVPEATSKLIIDFLDKQTDRR